MTSGLRWAIDTHEKAEQKCDVPTGMLEIDRLRALRFVLEPFAEIGDA